MNMVEKILARASGRKAVEPGDVVVAQVDLMVMHDLSSNFVMKVLETEMENASIQDPSRIAFVFDHNFSPATELAAQADSFLPDDLPAAVGIEREREEQEHDQPEGDDLLRRDAGAQLDPEILSCQSHEVGEVRQRSTSLVVASMSTRAGSCVDNTIVRSP